MIAANGRLTAVRGTTIDLDLVVTNPDGSARDLSAGTLFFTLKHSLTEARLVFKSSAVPAEITIDADPTTGLATVHLLPADTSSLAPDPYMYDVHLWESATVIWALQLASKLYLVQAATDAYV